MANGNNVFWVRQVVFEFQCYTKQHKQKITMKTNDKVTSFDDNQKWYLAMELKIWNKMSFSAESFIAMAD